MVFYIIFAASAAGTAGAAGAGAADAATAAEAEAAAAVIIKFYLCLVGPNPSLQRGYVILENMIFSSLT